LVDASVQSLLADYAMFPIRDGENGFDKDHGDGDNSGRIVYIGILLVAFSPLSIFEGDRNTRSL
jgi:hypothetical protein